MEQPYKSVDLCCGCGACAAACPKNAITMTEDAMRCGALLPVIDQTKCIDCGLCERICRYPSPELRSPHRVLAGSWMSDDIMQTASGGIFGALATACIADGGIVYGCAPDAGDISHARIVRCEDVTELPALFGSKYVHSTTADSYRQVKRDLDAGRKVLYSGLPCQIGGLLSYLRKPYENLTAVDIICHGTPPGQMFGSYIRHLEKFKGGKITDFKFRVKERGWGPAYIYSYKYQDKNGHEKSELHPYRNSIYYRLFLSGSIYRECCYGCPYAGPDRCSDLTIGDFWGVEEFYSDIAKQLNAQRGISAIMVNTANGSDALVNWGGELSTFDVDYAMVRKRNGQLNRPSRRPSDHDVYMDAFRRKGYRGILQTYFRIARWPYLIKEYAGILIKEKILGLRMNR